jgi:hypothetical protein
MSFRCPPSTSNCSKDGIYLDAWTGTSARSEGGIVKSPSLFIKSIHSVQDYVDIAGFTFPSHIHSEAKTRVVGSAVVDIYDQDYQPVSSAVWLFRFPLCNGVPR